MRLTVDRRAFAAVLAQAAKYVVARTAIPVLSTVLLRTGNGEVEVVVTDLDRLFRATIDARITAEGTIAASAVPLAGFVRGAAGTEVELVLAGSLLEVRSGHARSRIPTLAAADFPEPFGSPAGSGFEIDGAELAACLDAVSYAVSKEEARYYLRGVNWSIHDGRLELAATTGHILSTISIETPAGADGLKPLIVPDFAMPVFTGPVRVDVADTFIRFSGVAVARVSVATKLIDGTFPDYRRIISPAQATATVARKALADAVGRCLPITQAGKIRAPVDLVHDTEGELVVQVNSDDGAEIEDRIDIEGSQFALSPGGRLLAETLASFDGKTIEIGLAGVGDNVRFAEPGNEHRLAIIMPTRGTVTQRVGPPTPAPSPGSAFEGKKI